MKDNRKEWKWNMPEWKAEDKDKKRIRESNKEFER
jgi:hypothetical protein